LRSYFQAGARLTVTGVSGAPAWNDFAARLTVTGVSGAPS
jgi:hypothetical protein